MKLIRRVGPSNNIVTKNKIYELHNSGQIVDDSGYMSSPNLNFLGAVNWEDYPRNHDPVAEHVNGLLVDIKKKKDAITYLDELNVKSDSAFNKLRAVYEKEIKRLLEVLSIASKLL